MEMFCENNMPLCVSYGAEGCIEQTMVPATACTERVEGLFFILSALLLLLIYFAIGVLGGWVIQRKKF